MDIKASVFVKRQTRTSEFSYFDGSWEEVEQLAIDNADKAIEGGREGVKLISVTPERFYSSLVEIDDSVEFETIFTARRKGEKSYKKNITYGKKAPANHVDIVIYHKDVLDEDPTDRENRVGSEWEIVSVNATTSGKEAPMTPQTMARNQLADTDLGVGGSKVDYSGYEFAESIMFWNTHALISERE
jgi:hypothetical protein